MNVPILTIATEVSWPFLTVPSGDHTQPMQHTVNLYLWAEI